MDCMDCHNRPSHPFAATASRAVDQSMTIGAMPRDLPFVKREAVAALEKEYPDETTATATIADRMRGFYRTGYPSLLASRSADVDRAIAETQKIYRRNVFPKMKVTWGSYPNNIGHTDFPGCFRCHDDSHKTKDGAVIRQDCDLCHAIE
jgi:hypothetical protein